MGNRRNEPHSHFFPFLLTTGPKWAKISVRTMTSLRCVSECVCGQPDVPTVSIEGTWNRKLVEYGKVIFPTLFFCQPLSLLHLFSSSAPTHQDRNGPGTRGKKGHLNQHLTASPRPKSNKDKRSARVKI